MLAAKKAWSCVAAWGVGRGFMGVGPPDGAWQGCMVRARVPNAHHGHGHSPARLYGASQLLSNLPIPQVTQFPTHHAP